MHASKTQETNIIEKGLQLSRHGKRIVHFDQVVSQKGSSINNNWEKISCGTIK